jgi:protein arginine kinase activator
MKCQHCDEKALFHITEIAVEGDVSEVHLCWRHAQEYMREPEPAAAEPLIPAVPVSPSASVKPCPVCKITFGEFRNTGRLGCAHDYKEFGEELRPLIENIHGSLRHTGKAPRRLPTGRTSDLLRLRQEMQQAVSREDYERAAQLRDMIEGLDKQN